MRSKQRLDAAGLGNRVALRQGDAGALPFADAAFATVVTTFPAPFVLSPQVQAEIARVLRPGGSWVVLDGVEPGGRDPWSLLLRAMLARPAPSDRGTRRTMRCAAASVSFPARLAAAGYQVAVQAVSVRADRVTVLIAQPLPAESATARPTQQPPTTPAPA
jgi:SAM-dependent methyltransferase